MRIVVDAMGGDFAPLEIVKGSVEAARVYNLTILLVGDKEKIHKELAKYNLKGLQIEVIHAQEVIAMHEHPATAVRKKKESSIVIGTKLIKEGQGDALFSAGNTGAAMAASLLTLGRIKGIDRPAIASILPTVEGITLLLDAGANAESKSLNLYQYAVMGSIYADKILGVPKPKVGLLNIGEEDTKGNELYQTAHEMLKSSQINFIGNIEGRDITKGTADVVVCDGFVGNVVLKFGEGLVRDLMGMIKEEVSHGILAKIGAALLYYRLKKLKNRLDYTEYGGAPLLGINGISIIGHGSSDANAVKNGIRVAKECVENNFVTNIKESLQEKVEQELIDNA